MYPSGVYSCNNRKYAQLEGLPRIDSFELRNDDDLLSTGKRYIYYEWDYNNDNDVVCLLKSNGDVFQMIEVEEIHNKSDQIFWICPKCGRRFRFLYFVSTSFNCRVCSGIQYRSNQTQSDSFYYWFWHGVWFCEKKLGYKHPQDITVDDFLELKPEKPKRMHQKTYDALIEKLQWYQYKCNMAMRRMRGKFR